MRKYSLFLLVAAIAVFGLASTVTMTNTSSQLAQVSKSRTTTTTSKTSTDQQLVTQVQNVPEDIARISSRINFMADLLIARGVELRPGDTRSDVAIFKNFINLLRLFEKLELNGDYDEKTERVVLELQKMFGVEADGKITAQLVDIIRDSVVIAGKDSSYSLGSGEPGDPIDPATANEEDDEDCDEEDAGGDDSVGACGGGGEGGDDDDEWQGSGGSSDDPNDIPEVVIIGTAPPSTDPPSTDSPIIIIIFTDTGIPTITGPSSTGGGGGGGPSIINSPLYTGCVGVGCTGSVQVGLLSYDPLIPVNTDGVLIPESIGQLFNAPTLFTQNLPAPPYGTYTGALQITGLQNQNQTFITDSWVGYISNLAQTTVGENLIATGLGVIQGLMAGQPFGGINYDPITNPPPFVGPSFPSGPVNPPGGFPCPPDDIDCFLENGWREPVFNDLGTQPGIQEFLELASENPNQKRSYVFDNDYNLLSAGPSTHNEIWVEGPARRTQLVAVDGNLFANVTQTAHNGEEYSDEEYNERLRFATAVSASRLNELAVHLMESANLAVEDASVWVYVPDPIEIEQNNQPDPVVVRNDSELFELVEEIEAPHAMTFDTGFDHLGFSPSQFHILTADDLENGVIPREVLAWSTPINILTTQYINILESIRDYKFAHIMQELHALDIPIGEIMHPDVPYYVRYAGEADELLHWNAFEHNYFSLPISSFLIERKNTGRTITAKALEDSIAEYFSDEFEGFLVHLRDVEYEPTNPNNMLESNRNVELIPEIPEFEQVPGTGIEFEFYTIYDFDWQ